MKKVFISAIMGILALLAVNLTSVFTGVGLPISLWTLGLGSVLGIPGVISMLVMGKIIA